MPKEVLQLEVKRLQKKYSDEDELLVALAKKFNISAQAMGIRLVVLGATNFWNGALNEYF